MRTPRRSPQPAAARRSDVEISPREIQTRIRSGESPQELATSYGVPVDRVMRFAGPVLDERLRITDEARRARAHRENADAPVEFGESVDARFAAHGISPVDVSWDSHRREDGAWVVRAEWTGGSGRHTADWIFHRSSRSVTPLDSAATDLLSDRPIRPVVPPEEPRHLHAAPPLSPGVVAFPPMPDAHTGPMPRFEEVFDQEASDAAPAQDLGIVEPPLPLEGAGEDSLPPPPRRERSGSRGRAESDEDRAARSRIPAWDDILLGVRRKD